MKNGLKKAWRLWALALGQKAGKDDCEANIIAAIRTIPVLMFVVTDVLIVANILTNWGCTP